MSNFKNKKFTSSDILIGLFLTIVIAIIPLVCKYTLVAIRSDEINAIRTGTGYNDIFSNTKSVLLMCMAVVTALFLIFDIFSNDGLKLDIKAPYVVLAGAYIVLAILSAVFSSYKSVAFLGATERYEGLFIWICYIIFFIAASAYATTEKRAKLLISGFLLSGFLLGIIGLLQFMKVPVFNTEFVSKLVMGSSYKGTLLQIKYESVFATLYNPNCAGIYFGMMSSLFVILSIFLPVKSKLKYASIVIAVLCLISTAGTSSVGGFLGLVCGVGFSVIIAVCYFIFKKKSKAAAIVSVVSLIAIIIAGTMFINSDAETAQKIRIIANAVSSREALNYSNNFYKDVNINGNNGNVITSNGVYTIVSDKENTVLLHDNTEMTPASTNSASEYGGIVKHYNDEDMSWDLYLYEDSSNLYHLTLISTDSKGNEKYFMFGDIDGELKFLDKFFTPVDLNEEVSSYGFKGIERLGSNRGYIWSRSIPLLFNNIIIGSGPDCFEFEFPQYDVKSKLIYLNDPYVIIDKPHNMYLQFGINTGVLSLFVMLALFALYAGQTIKSIFNSNNNFITALKLGILAGVTAYLAAGLTTDSVVSVAPVFWVLIGMGFGVNMIGKKILTKEERQIEKMRKKIKQ